MLILLIAASVAPPVAQAAAPCHARLNGCTPARPQAVLTRPRNQRSPVQSLHINRVKSSMKVARCTPPAGTAATLPPECLKATAFEFRRRQSDSSWFRKHSVSF